MNETEALYRGRLAALSPDQRVQMACRMFATAKALARAGLRAQRGPMAAAEERVALFLRLFGHDFDDAQRNAIVRHLRRATACSSPSPGTSAGTSPQAS